MMRTVLRGTLDAESPLSLLRGQSLVLSDVSRRVDEWYDAHIDRTSVACVHIRDVHFPPPTGVVVNMMPIKLFDLERTLPASCAGYADMISWLPVSRYKPGPDEYGMPVLDKERVAYLTIEEGPVPAGRAQRRPGLHVERPGHVLAGGSFVTPDSGRVGALTFRSLAWGLGTWHVDRSGVAVAYPGGTSGVPVDGIYTASSVSDTCRVWPAQVVDPLASFVDDHGGIEHARERLGEGRTLAAGEMWWLTDRTPHESLPLAPGGPAYRQFFRLVVGRISVWYSRHSTPNPLGVPPDAPVSDEDKFEGRKEGLRR